MEEFADADRALACFNSARQLIVPYYLFYRTPGMEEDAPAPIVKVVLVTNKNQRFIILETGRVVCDLDIATEYCAKLLGAEPTYDHWFLRTEAGFRSADVAAAPCNDPSEVAYWKSRVRGSTMMKKPTSTTTSAPVSSPKRAPAASATRSKRRRVATTKRGVGLMMSDEMVIEYKQRLMKQTPPDRWTDRFIAEKLLYCHLVVPKLTAAEQLEERNGPIHIYRCTFVHPDGTPIVVTLPATALVAVPDYRSIISAAEALGAARELKRVADRGKA